MIRQYIKQALQMLKENPLVSVISILGTALSISMVMVVALYYQVVMAEYRPESKRGRMLYVKEAREEGKEGMTHHSHLSVEVIRECFYTLQTPEAVTAVATDRRPVSLPDRPKYKEYTLLFTDPSFWKVFDPEFRQGKPFTEADFQSGIRVAVVSEGLARRLFQTSEALGRTIVIDFLEYRICGVVKDVSRAARDAFADVWMPYTAKESLLTVNLGEGMVGPFAACILAAKRSDFKDIRAELDQTVARYNAGKENYTLKLMNNPLTRAEIGIGSTAWKKVDWLSFLGETGALVLFLLLIPALNLTGIIQSSIWRRKSEMGIRKAFGATSSTLLKQVLCENCATTFLGGILGFGLSFAFLSLFKGFLLKENVMISADMLLQPLTFVAALFFVLLLNLLSASIPAIRTVRSPVVEALKD
jgi:putative ABC transport system permease protein